VGYAISSFFYVISLRHEFMFGINACFQQGWKNLGLKKQKCSFFYECRTQNYDPQA